MQRGNAGAGRVKSNSSSSSSSVSAAVVVLSFLFDERLCLDQQFYCPLLLPLFLSPILRACVRILPMLCNDVCLCYAVWWLRVCVRLPLSLSLLLSSYPSHVPSLKSWIHVCMCVCRCMADDSCLLCLPHVRDHLHCPLPHTHTLPLFIWYDFLWPIAHEFWCLPLLWMFVCARETIWWKIRKCSRSDAGDACMHERVLLFLFPLIDSNALTSITQFHPLVVPRHDCRSSMPCFRTGAVLFCFCLTNHFNL